jgi:hypothetical protein
MGRTRQDLTGQTFGELLVTGFAGTINRRTFYYCRCRHGNEVLCRSDHLKGGVKTSCRCEEEAKKAEREKKKQSSHGNYKHGARKEITSEYRAWSRIRMEGVPSYWDDFVQFFCDVGEKPSERHVIAKRIRSKPHGKENTYWKNLNEERAAADQLTAADLPDECIVDLRSILRAAATAG